MPKREKLLFQVADYLDKTVIFTKKKWREKQGDHPELLRGAFLDCAKRALRNPDEVWEDYADKKARRCYYKKYSSTHYAKVVVFIKSDPRVVITAYKIDNIKESKYSNTKRIL